MLRREPEIRKESELILTLIPAPGEQPLGNAYQRELEEFERSLTRSGIKFSTQRLMRESVTTTGFRLSEFYLAASTLSTLSTLLPAVLPALLTTVAVWLKTRPNRKVKVKLKEFQAEASNVDDLEKALGLANKYRKGQTVKRIIRKKKKQKDKEKEE